MKREVVLTLKARQDLNRLVDFLIEVNPTAAREVGVKVRAALRSLAALSERGRPILGGFRELVVPFGRRAYIIQYRVDPTVVAVIRIFHSLEDRSNT